MKTQKEKIEEFLGNKDMQIEREYWIYYGVLPAFLLSIDEKEERRKRAVKAVYEMGVRDGKLARDL